MRYFWIFVFGLFTYVLVMFTSLNDSPVTLHFKVHGIPSFITAQAPLFLPIILAFIAGLLVTTVYFFSYHTRIRFQHRTYLREIRRLKKIVLQQRAKASPEA